MSNCGIHDNYYGAMGYCPSCRIIELEAEVERLREAAQAAADCAEDDEYQRDSMITLRKALEAGNE